MTRTLVDDRNEELLVKTVRGTSQLERFFREAKKVVAGGNISAPSANLGLGECCLHTNVSICGAL
mgnify:CR=1 FL=1|jgi:hypothetical protein